MRKHLATSSLFNGKKPPQQNQAIGGRSPALTGWVESEKKGRGKKGERLITSIIIIEI